MTQRGAYVPAAPTGNTKVNLRYEIALLVGLASWWPFLRTGVSGPLMAVGAPGQSWVTTLTIAACLACMLVSLVATLSQRAKLSGTNTLLRTTVGIAGLAASLLNVCVLAGLKSQTAIIGATLLYGALWAAAPTLWGIVLTQKKLAPHRIASIVMASFVLSVLVGFTTYLPWPWEFIRPILAPLLTCGCLVVCLEKSVSQTSDSIRHDSKTHSAGGFHGTPSSPYALAVVLLIACSLMLGVSVNGSMELIADLSSLLRNLATLALSSALLVVHSLKRTQNLYLLRSLLGLGLLGLAGITLGSLFQGTPRDLGLSLVSCIVPVSSMLMYLIVLSPQYACKPKHVAQAILIRFELPQIASSLILTHFPLLLNTALGLPSDEFWGDLSLACGVALAIALIAVMMASVDRETPATTVPGDSTANNEEPASSALQDLATSWGLTTRELDVARLLLSGYTVRGISHALDVSIGTVQTHTKGIYRKAAVHSRQELVDKVNQEH